MVQWADVTIRNHEQVKNNARAFIDTRLDEESSASSMKSAVSTKMGKTSASRSSKLDSMTSSQGKKAQLAAKLRHEESERRCRPQAIPTSKPKFGINQ